MQDVDVAEDLEPLHENRGTFLPCAQAKLILRDGIPHVNLLMQRQVPARLLESAKERHDLTWHTRHDFGEHELDST